jgi:hypothetical protein
MLVMVAIEAFSILELYFMQDRCMFNGAAMFSGWEISKEVPEVHEMVRYLVNWVAGMKMIVFGLLSVLALTAPAQTLLYSGVALVLAISSFFWRMFPLVRKFDTNGFIKPKGRARTLGAMVAGLELILVASVMIDLFV